MKVVGLVTEYNPFHNGHLYHLEESKKQTQSTHSIAVMSGHFLQRGEPAILDKWSRAKAAVEAGVDLVLEIPTLFSCSSAEYFAFGSVALLNSLNIVDTLCFGSEDGQLETMNNIADKLLSNCKDFEARLQNALNEGHSYPKARTLALETDFDFKANNILGIEYLKALKQLNSSIEPATIKRVHAAYLDENLSGHIASATAIRKHAHDLAAVKAYVPTSTFNILNQHQVYPKDMTQIILYKIRSSSLEALRDVHDMAEGLEYKIKKVAEKVNNFDELIEGVISKRFTKTRIQRILVKMLLNIKKEDMINIRPAYGRVLAFNDQGQQLLKKIKKCSDVPIITNINKCHLDEAAKKMLDYDILATNIYKLLTPNYTGGDDYLKQPIRVSSTTTLNK